MQFSSILVALACATGVMADLHNYANCYSRIQPIGNNNSCPKKRGVLLESVSLEKRSYADNRAATIAACNSYRNRNTGNKQWDKCPDCVMGWRHTTDSSYCVDSCNSAAKHIGGDEWEYYCKMHGADGGDAY